MTDLEIAWLAGIIEGEGCIDKAPKGYNKRFYPRIRVGMTDEDVVARVASLFKRSYATKDRESPRKPISTTEVCGKDAVAIMTLIYPLMGERRKAKIDEVLFVEAIV